MADPTPLRRFDPSSNPYPSKKQWPPSFEEMDSKHQFRLERRYRRRTANAYQNPKWIRGTKIAQFIAIGGVMVYAVSAMDWGTKEDFDWGVGEVKRSMGLGGGNRGIDDTLDARGSGRVPGSRQG